MPLLSRRSAHRGQHPLGAHPVADVTTLRDFRRAIVTGTLALVVLAVGSNLGGLHAPQPRMRLVVGGLAALFTVLGILATRGAANGLARAARHTSPAAGTTARVLGLLFGYLIVLGATLGMLTVPWQHLLLGGAVTGVIAGIAAQQPLSNLFAGLVLLLARPVAVGHAVRVHSGALGGPLDGTITDIGLIYTTLSTAATPTTATPTTAASQERDTLLVPNTALLNSALRTGPSVQDTTAQDTTAQDTAPAPGAKIVSPATPADMSVPPGTDRGSIRVGQARAGQDGARRDGEGERRCQTEYGGPTE